MASSSDYPAGVMIGDPTAITAEIVRYRASEISLGELAAWMAAHTFADPERGPAGDLFERDYNADPEPAHAGTFGEVLAARAVGLLTAADLAAIAAAIHAAA